METPTGWKLEEGKLVREFIFANEDEATVFLGKVAEIAKRLNHDPEVWQLYSRVVLTLVTHDEGDKVTDKDKELAGEINRLEIS